jgi:hypothetical protein
MSKGRRVCWLGASAAFGHGGAGICNVASFQGFRYFEGGVGIWGGGSSEAGQTETSDDSDSSPMGWAPKARGIPPWPSKGAKSLNDGLNCSVAVRPAERSGAERGRRGEKATLFSRGASHAGGRR